MFLLTEWAAEPLNPTTPYGNGWVSGERSKALHPPTRNLGFYSYDLFFTMNIHMYTHDEGKKAFLKPEK